MSHWSDPDALDVFLAGQRELAELDVEVHHRKIPPPPGLQSNDPRLRLIVAQAAQTAEHDIALRTGAAASQQGLAAPPPPVTTQPALPVVRPAHDCASARTKSARPSPRQREARKIVGWGLAGAAAAAMLLLVVGVSQSTTFQRDLAAPTLESASQLAERQPHSRPFRVSPLRERPRARRHVPRLPDPVEVLVPRRTAPLEQPTEPPRRVAKRDRLVELESKARAQLAEGNLSGAQQSFRRLAKRAGRTSRAELAYGELFALARRAGDTKAQASLWREYVRRFPRGRFADDARAGLCRRSPEARRARCWGDYLDDFPTGSHRVRAGRELDTGSQR